MIRKTYGLLVFLIGVPLIIFASSGYTSAVVPIEIQTGNDGILVFGAFGNPGDCADADMVYLKNDTNEYNFVKAMVLSAFMGGKRIRFFVDGCYGSDHWSMGLVYPYRNVGLTN